MKDHKEQMKPLQAVIFFGIIFVVGVILYAVSVKMQPEKTDLYYENIGRISDFEKNAIYRLEPDHYEVIGKYFYRLSKSKSQDELWFNIKVTDSRGNEYYMLLRESETQVRNGELKNPRITYGRAYRVPEYIRKKQLESLEAMGITGDNVYGIAFGIPTQEIPIFAGGVMFMFAPFGLLVYFIRYSISRRRRGRV